MQGFSEKNSNHTGNNSELDKCLHENEKITCIGNKTTVVLQRWLKSENHLPDYISGK